VFALNGKIPTASTLKVSSYQISDGVRAGRVDRDKKVGREAQEVRRTWENENMHANFFCNK